MGAQTNKALVQRYLEMWNSGDEALAAEVLAPDWRDHNHPEVTSLEAVKQALRTTRNAFPDFHIAVESIISEGDRVALRAVIQRTQQGSLVVSRVMWFVRIRDGKMAELWTGTESSA